MDKSHLDPYTNLLTEEYVQGIGEFMRLVQQQPDAKSGILRCPCSTCNNNKVIKEFDVWTYLYMKGFSRNYKVWYLHGKTGYEYGSTSEPQHVSELQHDIRLEESRTDIDYGVGRADGILPEDNLAPGSYYEVQKLVAGLQLPYEVIYVCIDNCMIYWRADETRNVLISFFFIGPSEIPRKIPTT
ncbi:hypothetical protein YC2023_067263 [Brassica napus]